MLWLILGIALGVQIGYYHQDLKRIVKNLKDDPKPDIGATLASYQEVNENAPSSSSTIVEPKTPALIEWEAAQKLEDENLKVKVKPSK